MLKKHHREVSKFQFLKIFFGIYFLFFGIFTNAQCAMCRASLESSDNVKQAEAVNDGVVFLMVIPYVLVAIVSFGVYRIMKSKKNTFS